LVILIVITKSSLKFFSEYLRWNDWNKICRKI